MSGRTLDLNRGHLEGAYLTTSYRVFDPPLEILIGEAHPLLDQLLAEKNAQSWAYITAWNPHSQIISLSMNQEYNGALLKAIKALGFCALKGQGEGADGDWSPEDSFLVLGISLAQAHILACAFSQNAFVYGELGQVAELIWACSDGQK